MKLKNFTELIEEQFSNVKENLKVKLKVKNLSNNPLPKYETDGASGFDLRAFLSDPVFLKPGDFALIPTGLYFEIPNHFEIQIRPRSGLAAKNGVTVLNTPGTIDSDYTGECKIILINHSKNSFKIENGDRIAQGVLAPVFTNKVVSILEVENIDKETERKGNGFGSTGV